jgi:hypothetical protein
MQRELCKTAEQSEQCRVAAAWLEDTLLIDEDIFAGEQHALKMLPPAPSASAIAQNPRTFREAATH